MLRTSSPRAQWIRLLCTVITYNIINVCIGKVCIIFKKLRY